MSETWRDMALPALPSVFHQFSPVSEECLMAKALVQASGFIAAQFRAASLVQALIEAETAAARLSGSSPNKGQSESTGDEETAAVHVTICYNVATIKHNNSIPWMNARERERERM